MAERVVWRNEGGAWRRKGGRPATTRVRGLPLFGRSEVRQGGARRGEARRLRLRFWDSRTSLLSGRTGERGKLRAATLPYPPSTTGVYSSKKGSTTPNCGTLSARAARASVLYLALSRSLSLSSFPSKFGWAQLNVPAAAIGGGRTIRSTFLRSLVATDLIVDGANLKLRLSSRGPLALTQLSSLSVPPYQHMRVACD